MKRRKSTFTLVELLTVAAIVILLLSLLLPSLMKAKNYAYRTVCVGNLKQLYLPIPMYVNDYDQYILPGQLYSYWMSVMTSSYLSSKKTGKGSVFACPSGISEVTMGTNYMYAKKYGHYYEWITNGNNYFAPKKISSVAKLSSSSIIIDGRVKSLGWGPIFDGSSPTWGDFRHSAKLNVLWLDGHVELRAPYSY